MTIMNALITGGLGFVGRHIAQHLLSRGHRVTITDMPAINTLITHPALTYISADTTRPGAWQESVAGADTVINLAGASIFGRWTKSRKKIIRDSRVLTTRNIVDALPRKKGTVLYSTSA
jgi:uncharacterized protein